MAMAKHRRRCNKTYCGFQEWGCRPQQIFLSTAFRIFDDGLRLARCYKRDSDARSWSMHLPWVAFERAKKIGSPKYNKFRFDGSTFPCSSYDKLMLNWNANPNRSLQIGQQPPVCHFRRSSHICVRSQPRCQPNPRPNKLTCSASSCSCICECFSFSNSYRVIFVKTTTFFGWNFGAASASYNTTGACLWKSFRGPCGWSIVGAMILAAAAVFRLLHRPNGSMNSCKKLKADLNALTFCENGRNEEIQGGMRKGGGESILLRIPGV